MQVYRLVKVINPISFKALKRDMQAGELYHPLNRDKVKGHVAYLSKCVQDIYIYQQYLSTYNRTCTYQNALGTKFYSG